MSPTGAKPSQLSQVGVGGKFSTKVRCSKGTVDLNIDIWMMQCVVDFTCFLFHCMLSFLLVCHVHTYAVSGIPLQLATNSGKF